MVERIQDLNLPNSNITKIIRDSLPADVNMDKGKKKLQIKQFSNSKWFPGNRELFRWIFIR